MSSPLWLYVGVGGSIGAIIRYALARWAGDRFSGVFPWGTMLANASGAFMLGLLHGNGAAEPWLVFLGTGILGGLTTFSTWMIESFRLVEEGEYQTAVLNVFGAVVLGMLLYGIGYTLAGGRI